jgi:hypothetical protein
MATTVYNKPAPHASGLARTAIRTSALYAAGAGLTVALGYFFVPGLWPVWVLVALVLAGVASNFYTNYGKARVGVASEKKVASVLARSNSGQVLFNSCMLGAGGDADHVILGPCAVVVETKTGFGNLHVRDGRVYSGERPVGKDEIAQVTRQSVALSRILGVPVTSVVCVADAKGSPKRVGNVLVCNAKDLPRIVKTSPAVIGTEQLPALVERLRDVHTKTTVRMEEQHDKRKTRT